MMRLELSRFIQGDLEEIADRIAEDNPRRAVSFIREIREAFDKIAGAPLLYQLRRDIEEDARLAVVGRYVILSGLMGTSSGSSVWSTEAAIFRRCLNSSRQPDGRTGGA